MRCLTNRLGTDKKSGQVLKHLALWWNKLPDSLFWLPPTARRVKTAPLLGKGIFCLQAAYRYVRSIAYACQAVNGLCHEVLVLDRPEGSVCPLSTALYPKSAVCSQRDGGMRRNLSWKRKKGYSNSGSWFEQVAERDLPRK